MLLKLAKMSNDFDGFSLPYYRLWEVNTEITVSGLAFVLFARAGDNGSATEPFMFKDWEISLDDRQGHRKMLPTIVVRSLQMTGSASFLLPPALEKKQQK